MNRSRVPSLPKCADSGAKRRATAREVIEFDELKLHCPVSGDPHEVVWSEDSNGSAFSGQLGSRAAWPGDEGSKRTSSRCNKIVHGVIYSFIHSNVRTESLGPEATQIRLPP